MIALEIDLRAFAYRVLGGISPFGNTLQNNR